MLFAKWQRSALALIWTHLLAVFGSGIVYAYITFAKSAPFLDIFKHEETAPYYLITYAGVLISTLTFTALGLVWKDVFGHKDLRAELVSRGALLMGIFGSLLPLSLITMWNVVLEQPSLDWQLFVTAAQYLGKWISFVVMLLFACIMLLLFLLTKEHASVPKGWGHVALVLGIWAVLVALSCLMIPKGIFIFRALYLAGAIAYLVWMIWLAQWIKKVERMH